MTGKTVQRWATTLALLVTQIFAAPASHAALERVGPVNTTWGFPDWYQDTSGLMLDFCTPATAAELSGGWCLLLPPVPSVVPEIFPPPANNPDAFSVEHFYWAADAAAPRTFRFRMSLEGSFATLTVTPGQQIVFARMRAFFPTAPLSGNYTIYHPFGTMNVPNIVAGGKLFFTQDVGLTCAPGSFDCALATPMGPFLLPSATPGGAEVPPIPLLQPGQDPFYDALVAGGAATPLPGTGRKYIADPARVGPVTGSPLAPIVSQATVDLTGNPLVPGVVLNPNRYRVEVTDPSTGVITLVYDTDQFTLQGRVFEQVVPGRVTVDRASYARPTASGGNKLDVFATALPTVQGRVPGGAPLPSSQPILVYYEAPCGIDAAGALTVPVDPVTGAALPAIPMFAALNWKYVVGQSQPAVVPAAVCVEQTNGLNSAGQTIALFSEAPVTDQIFITESLFNPNNGTLSVKATSSDQLAPPLLSVGAYGAIDATGQLFLPLAAPPNKVVVTSTAGGVNERLVNSLYFTAPVNNVPVANNDAFTIDEDCSPTAALSCATPQIFDVLANDTIAGGPLPAGGVVAIVTPPALGTAVVNLDWTIGYTPNPNANGADSFSYTVTVSGFLSNVASAAITINSINDPPTAVNDSFTAPVNVAAALNVLGNDTDPDGVGDLGTAVNVIAGTGPAGAVWSVVAGAGGVVNFTTNAPGTYTFTYQAQDKGGKQVPPNILTSANVATATVVASGASVNITGATYTQNKARLTVTGGGNPNGLTVTATVFSPAGAQIAGPFTAVVTAGLWTVDQRTVVIPAGTCLNTGPRCTVVATAPGATPSTANLTVK
jgi:hypothetical protein